MPYPTSLHHLVEDYLADCRARGLSPKTLRDAYGYPLQRVLLPWCKEHGLTEAGHLDARTLNRFTSDLLTQGGRRGPLSRHTVDTYVRNVNLFLGWCRRQGEISDVRAQAPKLPRRILDVLSREEIDRLEAAAPAERDKVIVRLLADTGIRASELLGLRSGDLLEQGRDRLLRVLVRARAAARRVACRASCRCSPSCSAGSSGSRTAVQRTPRAIGSSWRTGGVRAESTSA